MKTTIVFLGLAAFAISSMPASAENILPCRAILAACQNLPADQARRCPAIWQATMRTGSWGPHTCTLMPGDEKLGLSTKK